MKRANSHEFLSDFASYPKVIENYSLLQEIGVFGRIDFFLTRLGTMVEEH